MISKKLLFLVIAIIAIGIIIPVDACQPANKKTDKHDYKKSKDNHKKHHHEKQRHHSKPGNCTKEDPIITPPPEDDPIDDPIEDPDEETPEDPAPTTDKIKNAMIQMTTTFENSDTQLHYNYAENIKDGRGITLGCIGFCTGTYDANILIKHYTELNPDNTLAKYIPALDKIDSGTHNAAGGDGNPSVEGLDGFIKDVQNCNDPLFKKAQMDMLDELYYNPAMKLADNAGCKYPLTRAFIYDSCVRHGEDGTRSIIRQAGTTPKQGTDELTFLKSMFTIRDKMLKNEGLGDTKRVDSFRAIIDNPNLVLPFAFSAYGDRFTITGVV